MYDIILQLVLNMEDLNDKGLFLDELQKLRVLEPDAAEQVWYKLLNYWRLYFFHFDIFISRLKI